MKMTVGFSGFRNNPFTNLITTSLDKTPEHECSVNKNQDFIMHLRDWHTGPLATSTHHLFCRACELRSDYIFLNIYIFFKRLFYSTWKLYEFRVSMLIRKVLSEHSHSFIYYVWLLWCPNGRIRYLWQARYGLCKGGHNFSSALLSSWLRLLSM